MSTFRKATFDTAVYASSRPTYPKQLFDFVFKYHDQVKVGWDTAVDLGCGTGQATIELTLFKQIVGVDPSAKMLAVARETTASSSRSNGLMTRFQYVEGEAENLSFLKDKSVDLMIAGCALV